MPSRGGEQGIALIAVLTVTTLMAALGLGVAVTLSTEPLATANLRDAGAALLVADAGVEIAAGELLGVENWSDVLGGRIQPALSDPLDEPFLTPEGGVFDVRREANRMTCGRAGGCSEAQRRASTRERPWGQRNPQWQPFLVLPFSRVAPEVRDYHLVVWVGDDVLEEDDRVSEDAVAGAPGRFAVRVLALALGPRGTRRSVEAVLSRPCSSEDGVETCEASIRVQSWHAVHPQLP